jgi:amino acid permease
MVFGMRAESRDWAGGYGSFRRQALRLGHVAAFALGVINVLYGVSSEALGELPPWAAIGGSSAMIAGGFLMPMVCLAAAWRRGLKVFFPLPATFVAVALGVQIWGWAALAGGR